MKDAATILLGFVLTTLVGGWWAARLQQKSWSQQNDVRLREAAAERAGMVCQELTALMDRRLYRMQGLLWSAMAEPVDLGELDQRREEYREVLKDWNEKLNMHLSLVGSYFGDAARARLDALYEEFKRVGEGVELAVRAAARGDDVTAVAACVQPELAGRAPGTLNDRVYNFGLVLTGQLRDGEVGPDAPRHSRPRLEE
jgi:hypothetical protein